MEEKWLDDLDFDKPHGGREAAKPKPLEVKPVRVPPASTACPHCGRSLRGCGLAGQLVECPACKGQFQMPGGAARADAGDPAERPGMVAAIRVMLIVGAVIAILHVLIWLVGSTGIALLWPGTYVAIVFAVMALIHATKGGRHEIPQYVLILQILCILLCDPVNLVMGIVGLVFLKDRGVVAYFRGEA